MLGAILIWAINFTSVKLALREMAPMAFNGVRLGLAAVAMLIVLVWRAKATQDADLLRMSRRDAWYVILLGLGGHTIYQLLFVTGMKLTTAANTSLLMSTSPIWVAVIGRALRVERITRLMWAGILVSFLGIIVLISGGNGRFALDVSTLIGDLLILGCAILWAGYTTASKPLLNRFAPLKLTAWSMAAGAVPLLVITAPAMAQQDWRAVSALSWAAVLFSALLSMVVGYLIWYTSVQRVGNARTAVYSNLTPIFAIVVAWIALGDRPALLQLLGAAIVLAGLILTRRGRALQVEKA